MGELACCNTCQVAAAEAEVLGAEYEVEEDKERLKKGMPVEGHEE